MRKVFVDLGAHIGEVSGSFAAHNPDYEIFCVEPNVDLLPHIHRRALEMGRIFNVVCGAAWISDGTIDLFSSGAPGASTIVPGKVEVNGWPQINYSTGQKTPCFDFSRWLMENFGIRDEVVVKMDIEGAEYRLLEKMLADRSLLLVKKIIIEWHQDRFPDVSVAEHQRLVDEVSRVCSLQNWS